MLFLLNLFLNILLYNSFYFKSYKPIQKKFYEMNHHNWYVIGEKNEFFINKLYKKTIWNNDYVIWKDKNDYYALDNHCSHRGASLSKGKLINNNLLCPYHGYEFNNSGILINVPGLNFTNTPCKNIKSYKIIEKNGFVYLNINSTVNSNITIYEEPESINPNCTYNFLNLPIKNYARLLSENSLDVMHIPYVHSFGNLQFPSPIKEIPPKIVNDYPNHYKTQYIYKASDNSIAKKIFNSDYLEVDNEFILPHTQIVRIKFGKYISTIITHVTPINITYSHFYMKTYRSYWYKSSPINIFEELYNYLGNKITLNMMIDTIKQDKDIVENIKLEHIDGKYNMKYDKFQNLYRTLYKKKINNLFNISNQCY